MRRLLLGVVLTIIGVVAASAIAIRAGAKRDYWSEIESLTRKGTAHGNPELVKYLRSLSRDQMLVAARQYCEEIQKTRPPDDWPRAVVGLMLPLAFYYEEILGVDVPKGTLKQETGTLSDDSLEKLLAIIADSKEVDFFRYALANMIRTSYAPHLTDAQQERCLSVLTGTLSDAGMPAIFRSECCESLRDVLQEGYWRVITADVAVQQVLRNGPPERRKNVFSLIGAGEIELARDTVQQLAPKRERIHQFRKVLAAIAKSNREPESLRKIAQQALDTSAKLPLLDAGGGADRRHRNPESGTNPGTHNFRSPDIASL